MTKVCRQNSFGKFVTLGRRKNERDRNSYETPDKPCGLEGQGSMSPIFRRLGYFEIGYQSPLVFFAFLDRMADCYFGDETINRRPEGIMEKRKLRIMGHEVTIILAEFIPRDLVLFVSPADAKEIEALVEISERVMKYLKATEELRREGPKR